MLKIPLGETLGQRIREIRGSRSQRAFSQLLGISTATLKRYETGERLPDAELIRRLCQEGGMDPAWLLWGDEHKAYWDSTGEVPVLSRPGEPPSWLGVSDQYVRIPYFPHTSASRPTDTASLPHANIAFSSQWLAQENLDRDRLCLVEAIGDGMAPSIPEKSLLLVCMTDPGEGLAEGIYLVWIGNRLLPKRIQPEWDGGILLRSDNPSYADQHLLPDQAAALQVFGHVVWIGHSLL